METVTYHSYYQTPHAVPASQPKNIEKRLAKLLGVVGFVLIVSAYVPSVWFTVKSAGGDTISKILYSTATEQVPENIEVKPVEKAAYQPSYDSSLPMESRLAIPSIGVDTLVREASLENYEDALRDGVWRATDFGTPANREKPTILVAHRFGYLKWTNLYRRKNSFYNLPKLKEGDTIEIVWRQRKYTYAIYKTEEGIDITDYQADLILYTCKDLTGDVKYFQYAKLLEI